MSKIKRYIRADANGEYVLHSDHEAVVDSMTAALVKLDGACLASEQEVARLRDEVEQLHAKLDRKEGQRKLAESECAAMRKDAERYRWLRDHPWRDNEQLEPVIRLHLNALWDDKIDAAMGADA